MRIGWIGPAGGDLDALNEAVEFFMVDVAADMVVYLGDDGAADQLAEKLTSVATGGGARSFLDEAAEVALRGDAEAIDALLRAESDLARLSALRILPDPPLRAVEMLDDRIVLMVHDKAVLGEDDIVNASVIVYGNANEVLLKRFGSRYFFSPGPLSGGCVGILEREEDGRMTAAAFDLSGMPVWRESLQWRTTKMSVSR